QGRRDAGATAQRRALHEQAFPRTPAHSRHRGGGHGRRPPVTALEDATPSGTAPHDPSAPPATPPATRRRWEAADTVISLAGGLIIIIFAIFGFLCWQGYWATIEAGKNRAQTAAN